jgi:hypothetical protein
VAVSMQKIVVTWTGFSGAPGYSTLFLNGASIISAATIGALWTAAAPFTPTGTIITVPSSGELVDPETGKVTGTWASGVGPVGNGAGTSSYAPQSGMQVKWQSTAFVNGRRAVGRTFFVPLNLNQYTTGGVILPATVTTMQTAANNMLGSTGNAVVVWHRPVYDHSTNPPTLVKPGATSPVSLAVVPNKVVTLRSRQN